MNTRIQKKHRYILYSLAMFVLLIRFHSAFSAQNWGIGLIIVLFLATVVGAFSTQYPGITFKNSLYLALLPLHLTAGAVFSIIYYPNLSFVFRIFSLAVISVLYYLIGLVNNIFLVVEDKRGTIPLYRVAVTWSQILLTIVAIPFFAGVFKLPLNSFTQNAVVAFSTFLFTIFLIWTTEQDSEVRNIRIRDRVLVSLLTSFFVFALGMSVSFIPTESFLRSLLISAVLMFGLSYVRSHYKNSIDRSLITEYGLIFIIFLLIVLIFRP